MPEFVYEGRYDPSMYGTQMEVGGEDVEEPLWPYSGKLVRLTVKIELLEDES